MHSHEKCSEKRTLTTTSSLRFCLAHAGSRCTSDVGKPSAAPRTYLWSRGRIIRKQHVICFVLFFWNLCFPFAFALLLTSLVKWNLNLLSTSNLSDQNFTFFALLHWNLYLPLPFPWTSTHSLLFYWNSSLSLHFCNEASTRPHFSFEISTHFLLFYWSL